MGTCNGAARFDAEAMCVALLNDFVDCDGFVRQLVVVVVEGSWVDWRVIARC